MDPTLLLLSVLLSILNSEWTNRGGGWCCLSPLPLLSKWFPTSGKSHVWPGCSCNQNRLRKKCLMADDSLRCCEPSFHSESVPLSWWILSDGLIKHLRLEFNFKRKSLAGIDGASLHSESLPTRVWIDWTQRVDPIQRGHQAQDYDGNFVSMTSDLGPANMQWQTLQLMWLTCLKYVCKNFFVLTKHILGYILSCCHQKNWYFSSPKNNP